MYGQKKVITGMYDKCNDKKDKKMLQGIRKDRGGGWGVGKRAGKLPRGDIWTEPQGVDRISISASGPTTCQGMEE